GLALAHLGRFAEAERDLEAALGPDHRFLPALLNRGALRWRQREHDRALADFQAVLDAPTDRRLIEVAYYRGQIQLERGKHAEALKDFQRFVAERPRFWPVYLLRARACFHLGQDERGLAELDGYLAGGRRELDPGGAEAHELRGRLLRRLLARGQVPAAKGRLALQQLLRAEKLGGRSATLFGELGAMHDNPRQAPVAVKYYSRGLEIEPGNTSLRLLRAWACAQHLKDYRQAQADFAQAARVEGDHPAADRLRAEAHSRLGFVQARQKKPAEAQASA